MEFFELKCHVLIDLKLGKFSPGDVGQMNMYLNFYKDNEMQEGDKQLQEIIHEEHSKVK